MSDDVERILAGYREARGRPVGRVWECLDCESEFTLQCEPSDVPTEWWNVKPGRDFPHPWETKHVADIQTHLNRRHQKECPWTCPRCGTFTITVPKE